MLHEVSVLTPEESRLVEGDAMRAILKEALTETPSESPVELQVNHSFKKACDAENDVLQLTNAMFFDIETTGFSPESAFVFLIGCICHDGKQWRLHQFLIRTVQEESDMLSSFFEMAGQAEILVHFNGNRFDLPFLAKRAEANHLEPLPDTIRSIDLYRHFGPLKKKLSLSRMKQSSLEKQAGWEREDRLTGKEVVKEFWGFTTSNDEKTMRLLLHHNRDDLMGMLQISRLEAYLQLFDGRIEAIISADESEEYEEHVRSYTLEEGAGRPGYFKLEFSSLLPVPRPLRIEKKVQEDSKDQVVLIVREQKGTLLLPIFDGILRYFFTDYKNYYYLPMEDQAIHKSVALYVDKKHREPARPDTCYTTKTGRFLPLQLSCCDRLFSHEQALKTSCSQESHPKQLTADLSKPSFTQAFRKDYSSGNTWISFTPELCEEKDALTAYAGIMIRQLFS